MKRSTNALHLSTLLASVAAIGLWAGTASANAPDLSYETILTDLDNPWDMAFLPDGTMFFTEKCRGLSVRMPSGDVTPLLGMVRSSGFDNIAYDLFCEGQAGMMGVAVDPDFDTNRRIYVMSTSSLTAPGSNRVMRFEVSADFDQVLNRRDIVTDIPFKPRSSAHPFGGPGAHNGGRIRFNPGDGFLYVTTGDTHNGMVPQSPTHMGGKVLRIDTEGNGAPGNNAPAFFDPRVYGYGFRNVQGIAFRPSDNRPIIAEHGPWHSDEITALVPGGNGGWDPRPGMGGRPECPDNYCGYSPNQMEGMDPAERAAFMPMTDLITHPDAMTPAWTNNGLSQGTSSAEFLTGDHWGEYEGRMVVGIMGIGFGGTPVGQRMDLVELTEDRSSVDSVIEMHLPMGSGRFRSVVQGPDGALYAAIDEGDIYRIMPN